MLRREPSITGTVDQFSHVCLYRFDGDGKKWEKHGYEGSMFIFEKYVSCSHKRVTPTDVRVQVNIPDIRILHFESHGY